MLYKHLFEPIMERFSCPKEKRRYVITFYVQGIMGILIELWEYALDWVLLQ